MKRTRRNFKRYILEAIREYWFVIIIYIIFLTMCLRAIEVVNKKYDKIYEIQQNQINEMIEMENK